MRLESITKKAVIITLSTVFILSLPVLNFAQQTTQAPSQENLLKEMELLEKSEKVEKKEGTGFGHDLIKNFHGSIRLRASQHMKDPPEREGADMRNTFGNILGKFTDKVGKNNWDLNIGIWTEFGNERNTYSGTRFHEWWQDTERRRRFLEVHELFLNITGTNYNAIIGKKTITNGISTLFVPADRMRPQDLNDPMDPKDLNLWQARVDYYLENFTLTGAFLPVYQENKVPSETSRWMGERRKGDPTEADFYDVGNLGMESDKPKISDTNFGYFFRAKTTYKGWDLFFSYYHGPNPYYVIREEERATSVPGVTKKVRIKEVVKVDDYACGFSTTYKKWEFHGEAVFNYAYDGKDDNYIHHLLGVTYTIDDWAKNVGLEKIDITVEHAYETITKRQSAENYVSSSKKSRLGRNDVFSRINFEYSDRLTFQFGYNFTLRKGESGRFQKYLAKYKIRDGVISKLSLEIFGGESESLYGRWRRNDRAVFELEYSF
ncbi:MAG: hypothetical protein N2317_01750 [Syntrophales bacterium]|nr:hypothetical protein [Syntrophales bacterium]